MSRIVSGRGYCRATAASTVAERDDPVGGLAFAAELPAGQPTAEQARYARAVLAAARAAAHG
jgi:hypothetical protein